MRRCAATTAERPIRSTTTCAAGAGSATAAAHPRSVASTTRRSKALPDVPTLAEAGIRDFEATAWFGVQAPGRTPRPTIERLGAEIDVITRDPGYIARIAELGGAPPALTPAGGTSPQSFDAFIRSEITKWAEVVKVSGATVD